MRDLEREVRERNAELEQANQQLRDEIAERKKVEADLRRNELFLNEAQRLSHTASWMYEVPSGFPRLMSTEMFRLMGLDPAEPVPPTASGWDVIHPDDRERVRKLVTASIIEKTDYEVEHRIVRPDGSIRIVAVVGHPVPSRVAAAGPRSRRSTAS